MKIMLDSSFLIGLTLRSDQWHELAINLAPLIDNYDTCITNIILAESMNSFSQLGGKIGNIIYNNLNQTNIIYKMNEEIYDDAMNIYIKYDGSIGFSDCTTIATMKKYNINYIVSYDSDFDNSENIIRIYNYKENNQYFTNINLDLQSK